MRLPARRARIDLGLKPTSSENPRLEDLETLWRLSPRLALTLHIRDRFQDSTGRLSGPRTSACVSKARRDARVAQRTRLVPSNRVRGRRDPADSGRRLPRRLSRDLASGVAPRPTRASRRYQGRGLPPTPQGAPRILSPLAERQDWTRHDRASGGPRAGGWRPSVDRVREC